MNLGPTDYESSQGARFIVTFEKSRGFFGDQAKSFETQLCTDETDKDFWKIQSLEEDRYEKIVSMLNKGIKQNDIAKKLGINKSTVCRHAKQAQAEGLINSKQSGNNAY